MSTTFYALRPPITSVRVVKDAPNLAYLTVNIFVAHQMSGSLQMSRDEVKEFTMGLRGIELVRRTAGENGPEYELINAIPDDAEQVISEYGDVMGTFELSEEMRGQEVAK